MSLTVINNTIMTNRKFFWPITLLLFLLISSNANAQLTAKGLGLANAYTASARGIDSPYWNPANLGLPDSPQFTGIFFSTIADFNNNSFSLKNYNHYNGSFWTQSDIENILNKIPARGFQSELNSSFKVLSFAVNHFAVTIGMEMNGFILFDKSFFDLALTGNELNKLYQIDNLNSGFLSYSSIGLSWGQGFKVPFADILSFGSTVKLLNGLGYANINKANLLLDTNEQGFKINGNYEITRALGSFGGTFNLGLAARFNNRWTVSLAVDNIVSSIGWSRDVKKEIGEVYGDSLIVLTLEDDEVNSIKDEIDYNNTSFTSGNFKTSIPTVIRFGTLLQAGPFNFTADYYHKFRNESWRATISQFSVGTEWHIFNILSLRSGLAYKDKDMMGTAFGIGMNIIGLTFDFGMMNYGKILPSTSKGVILAIEIGINQDWRSSTKKRVLKKN